MSSEEKMTKRCSLVQDMLSAYLDGELSVEDAALVSAHLEECLCCQEEFACLQRLHQAMAELPEVPLPQGFTEALHTRLLAETAVLEEPQDCSMAELPEDQQDSVIAIPSAGGQPKKFWQKSWFPRSIAAAMVLCVGLSVAGILKHDSNLPGNENVPMVASNHVAPQDIPVSQIGPLDNGNDGTEAAGTTEKAGDGATTEGMPQVLAQKKLKSGLPARKQEESVWLASRKEAGEQHEEEAAKDEPMVLADASAPQADGRAAAPANIVTTNTLVITSQDAVTGQQQVQELLANYSSANYTASNISATEGKAVAAVDAEKEQTTDDTKQDDSAAGGGSGETNSNAIYYSGSSEEPVQYVEYQISKQDMESFLDTASGSFTVASQILQDNLDDVGEEETVVLRIEFQP